MPSAEGQIFVSYSNEDRVIVHDEIRRLERLGFGVWYDKGRLQPGRVWNKEIRQAIADCACFIVFVTRDAVRSRNVRREVRLALKIGKPFIRVNLEKVEFCPPYQSRMRGIQALERYALRRYEYEKPLSRAIADYLKVEPRPEEKVERREPERVPPPDVRPDVLPKIVFFALVLSGGGFLFLALIAIAAPYFASASPNDPLNNRLMGLVAGIFFLCVALSLEGAAFVVYRVYLRRKKNG